MKKKALITGITGQDGAYLAEFLLQKGYPEVVIRIEDRDKYYDCLIEADQGKTEKLIF